MQIKHHVKKFRHYTQLFSHCQLFFIDILYASAKTFRNDKNENFDSSKIIYVNCYTLKTSIAKH